MAAAFDRLIGDFDISDNNASHNIAVGAAGVASGEVIFVAFSSINSAGSLTVSDTGGNTYTKLVEKNDGFNDWRIALFAAPVTVALVNGNNIACSTNANTSSVQRIAEAICFTGATGTTDGTAIGGTGHNVTNISTGNLTTTNANDVLVSGCTLWDGNATLNPSGGWTKVAGFTDNFSQMAYQIVAATSTYSCTWTAGASDSGITDVIGAVQATGGGGAALLRQQVVPRTALQAVNTAASW